MQTIDQTFHVTYRYPVTFTTDLFSRENSLLRDVIRAQSTHFPQKVLYVIDASVACLHPGLCASVEAYCRHDAATLALAAPPLLIEGGEQAKNDPSHVTAIQRAIHDHAIDRQAYVVVIGGGAVIDMVGYAAATAHRGVRLIRVPTTVLSQNDSAVGVKNSVNAFGKKNFLGTFAPPAAVLNDANFLGTLSDRDWRSGIAEAIKVALLKDPAFFARIEGDAGALNGREMAAMQALIYRCAELHLAHIATNGDPFEFGSSRPLDFGHWAAHKLEYLSDYRLRHGEAVAIGIALDATYSYLAGLLPADHWHRILPAFTAIGLAVSAPELTLPAPDDPDSYAVLAGLREFREHLGGQLTVMLLRGIGDGVEVHDIDTSLMVESIRLIGEYQATLGTHDTGGTAWIATPTLVR